MKKWMILALTPNLLLLPTQAISGGTYSPTFATLYAQQWAYSRNPNYRSFDSDCTNFFSQSLRAGGLTDDKSVTQAIKNIFGKIVGYQPIYDHINNWYHIKSLNFFDRNPSPTSFSSTWSIANSQATRLKIGKDNWKYDNVYSLGRVSNVMVELGDAIFAQWNPSTNPNINHAMIVTGFRKVGNTYEPRLTYHSSDAKNKTFTEFRNAALSQAPNTRIYVYRRALRSSIPPSWQVF